MSKQLITAPSSVDVPIAALPSAAATPRQARIPAIDFTKGALVLTMVLYHWWNYFVSPQGEIYRYLRFLTPSFIFISGLLVSRVYLSGYGVRNPKVPRRLLQRGLKVLAVFVTLNAVRLYVIPDARSGLMPAAPLDLNAAMAVFVTGNVAVAGSKIAAFPILIPIAYLLIVSAGLAVLCRYFRFTVHAAALLLYICVAALALRDISSGNLDYIAVGLLGMVLGLWSMEKVSSFVQYPKSVVGVYAAYLIVVTFFYSYVTQLLGIVANLMVMYLIGYRGRSENRLQAHIELLGKYSLFGYVIQIAILQVLRRLLPPGEVVATVSTFIAAFALTAMSVEVLDRLRRRTNTVDRLYKLVFA